MLLLSVALAYANALGTGFQFDDFNVIVDNPRVHGLDAWWRDALGIRPLLRLSYTLSWVSGAGVIGFHLVNLAVHAINSLLVFAVLCRLPALAAMESERTAIALGVSLLFALHPVQTEAVTYVSGRSVSLMACFLLLSILAYLRGAQSGSRLVLHLASPLAYIAACLTKEVAVVLPLALILVETGRPGANWRTMLKRQSVHWLVFALLLGALLGHPRYRSLLTHGLDARPLVDNLLTQMSAIAYLARQLVIPGGLNIDPDVPVLDTWNSALLGLVLVYAVLALWAVRARQRAAWVTFGIGWFFLMLAPTNSLIPRLDVVNDRQLYLAAIGPFLILAAATVRLAGQGLPRGPVIALAAFLLAGFGVLTWQRNRDYVDEITLWRATVRLSPNKARAHNNLGYAYVLAGACDAARGEFRRALELRPNYPRAQFNLMNLPGCRPSR